MLTRFQVEKILAGDGVAAKGRCGMVMARAGYTVAVSAGTPNLDLDDSISSALEYLGFPPADRTALTDADVALVPPAFTPRFLDLCEVFLMEKCLSQILGRANSISIGKTFSKSFTDSTDALAARITLLWEQYKLKYERTAAAPLVLPMDGNVRNQFDPTLLLPPGGWPPTAY